MPRHLARLWPLLLFASSYAGVINPDISAIGQVFANYTDDPLSREAKKVSLSLGETELQLDAPLNPFFNGAFVLSIDPETGIDVEEAYASMVRGLPLDLALKAGKYRLNFGKLNTSHPHAYPFIRTPRVLDPSGAALLPGEESFDEVAVEASTLFPITDSWSAMLSADVLQGSSFHPDSQGSAPAWLTHLSNSFIIDPAAIDIGISATRGTNDLPHKTYTTVVGVDAKAKIAFSPLCIVTIAGEALYKAADLPPDSLGKVHHDNRYGFYAYVNTQYHTRYNGGLLYEQYQDPLEKSKIDQALKPFVGFSVLEESTLLRLSYEYFVEGTSKGNTTVELQLLFSMGPHKAHQF